ncbi:hypothetical protein FCL40_06860 [Ferrimonas sediminicola]|uniref:Uncharacterized protein n=1 Tax=Ferrimonas sediminicola TaxID=2569538 RepID=A0A4U1BF75_9GAMM|nr:hypothetical protein [Ferrimonas sediminicola]TKB49868.1 hypothetical protein FCL40_06860 [Ferrimonas sediminicola]
MTPQQLLEHLFALPTRELDAFALSTVVLSLLHHEGESAQLMKGTLADRPHHWVIWQEWLVDFRYPGIGAPEAGIRPVGECSLYRGERSEVVPIPKVLLPTFCGGDHAHFDHLAARRES